METVVEDDTVDVVETDTGVTILFRVRLFRGDIIPTAKIPLCTESEETRFRVRLYSEWALYSVGT